MNSTPTICDEVSGKICRNRREFLVKAGTTACGLVLSLSALEAVPAQQGESESHNTDSPSSELIIKIDEKSSLNKVGGFAVFETRIGKVIIVRTAAASFSANTAICPHRGGPIKYDEKTDQLFCPWHDSRFNTKGQILKGPAESPLKAYMTQNAIVLIPGN